VLNIEDSFAKLKFEFDQKSSEIKALAVQQQASSLRLDDFLAREATAAAALKKTSAELEAKRRELANAGRAAKQLLSDSQARAEQIVTAAHAEAQKYLADVYTAVAALIEHHK
jgi:hypothetical protein